MAIGYIYTLCMWHSEFFAKKPYFNCISLEVEGLNAGAARRTDE